MKFEYRKEIIMKKNTFKVWSAVLAFIIGFEAASPEFAFRSSDANAVDIRVAVSGSGTVKSVTANETTEETAPVKEDYVYAPEAAIRADSAAKKLYGDVNGDGEVTYEDAEALEGKTLKNCPQGDVNADGKLDGNDADLINEYTWYDDGYFPVGKYYDPAIKYMTRAEWIHAIASVLVLDTGNKALQADMFGDLDGCDYADEITILGNMGIIDRDDDGNFRPDAYADRCFAAEVLNRLYGSESYDLWAEAIEKGWFKADNGEFHDKLYITEEETAVNAEVAKNAPFIIRQDMKLTADLTVDNDLWIWGELDLNGHKLTAKKSVAISGSLSVHKGSAVISGDLNVSGGYISMADTSDKITVNGNADIESYSELKAGTIEFKGNVKMEGFGGSGSNTVVLSGKKAQTLDLYDSSFSNLKITNSDSRSVIVSKSLYVTGKVTADGQKLSLEADPKSKERISVDIDDLTADSVEIKGDAGLHIGEFNGSSITVNGDAETFDETHLNGAAFTVTGDLYQRNILTPGGGTVHVDGEFENESGSYLVMADSNDKLYVGGDTHLHYLSSVENGVLEFCGILYLEDTKFSGENIAVFPGTGDVSIFTDDGSTFAGISIPDSDKRAFNYSGPLKAISLDCGESPLSIKGSSDMFAPGRLSCSEFTVDGNCVLGDISQGSCKKITLNGDVKLAGKVSLDGDEITVSGKLTSDPGSDGSLTEIKDSTLSAKEFVIENGQFQLSGGSFNVEGDISVKGGGISLDGAEMTSGGKCAISTKYSSTLSGSKLSAKELSLSAIMSLDESSVIVSGDVSLKGGRVSYKDASSCISAGGNTVLDLGGLRGDGKFSCAGDLTVEQGDLTDIILELTGEKAQNVVIPETDSTLAGLSVLNSDKRSVNINGVLRAAALSGDGKKVSISTDGLGIGAMQLDTDTEITGNVKILGTNKLQTDIDLNGHVLSVKGDLYQTAGVMNINKGKLDISGDYVTGTGEDKSALTPSVGTLSMVNEEDTVTVGGSFITMSSSRSELTDGTLEIKGDFYQYDEGSEFAFAASDKHKVIFSGKKKQTITFESYESSHFNYLEMTQEQAMYDFTNGQCWKFPGDANEDGSVDLKDVVLMRQSLSGWDVEICLKNVDVNGDGSFDLKDLTILRRYLAGGWDVTLQ